MKNRPRIVTVESKRGPQTQAFYELNGYEVKSWRVICGRRIQFVIVKK